MRATLFALLAATLFALLAGTTSAAYVSVADEAEAYPVLRRVGSLTPLRWDVGDLAARRLSAAAVRVSSRGARFVPAGQLLTGLGGWHRSPCTATPGALCRTPGNTTLFPERPGDVSIPGAAERVADGFAVDIAAQGCSRHAARQISDTDAYTVSLCDITQKGYHFLLVGDTVYSLERDEQFWFYLLVSVGAIVVVTSVAQNIATLLGGAGEATSVWLELGAAVLLLAVTWYGAAFVTVGDVVFYFSAVAYVALNTVYWALQQGEEGVPVNVLLGALMLTLCRLYDGAECEYLGPVLLLFLARAFHKAHCILQTPLYTGGWRSAAAAGERGVVPALAVRGENLLFFASQVAVLLDFLLAGLAHQFGFRALFARGDVGDAFFAVLTLVAYELSVLLQTRPEHPSRRI